MSIIRANGRKINTNNVTHVQIYGETISIFPVGYYNLRLSGDEAAQAMEQFKAGGFVGDSNMLINPSRFVVAEDGGATVRLILDGAAKNLIVSAKFLECLAGGEELSAQPFSSDGNSGNSVAEEPAPKKTRKKGAE